MRSSVTPPSRAGASWLAPAPAPQGGGEQPGQHQNLSAWDGRLGPWPHFPRLNHLVRGTVWLLALGSCESEIPEEREPEEG